MVSPGRVRVLTCRRLQRGVEVLVGNELRRVIEHRGAGGMILVVMAVEHVSDRRIREALRQLGLDPGRCLDVDRIRQDDSRGGHEKYGVVVVVLDAIEIAGDSCDGPHGLSLRLLREG